MSQNTNEKAVIDAEKFIWNSIKSKKLELIPECFTDDYRGVYKSGIVNRKLELENIRNVDLKKFSLSKTKVSIQKNNVAVLTYMISLVATDKGQNITGIYNASSVWVKQGRTWQVCLHSVVQAQ